MDSTRSKQHSLKVYKSSTSSYNHHHENNNCNTSSNHGIFRTTKIQRHTLKWRKDHYTRGNHRSKYQYKKNDVTSRKCNKSTEDVEEEERKKKLNDTARKLLSKLKTWNEEKNYNEEDLQQKYAVNQIFSESRCKHNEDKINSEDKPKRIAHSKKAKLVKNRTPKSFSQSSKTARYEVNKDTVKDFQNRIQHKLIEEIMQMPKENLQNVLNDPKINPIMELKMSRLVRENKLLIAQKLRALAESKMKSFDCSTNSQLLVEIDKLIDPVIETDLSVLPYELIKQMENVFQVQFDYSYNKADSQTENVSGDSATVNLDEEENFQTERKIPEQIIKEENNEDLSLYECSTDEDEEISAGKCIGSDKEKNLTMPEKILNEVTETKKIFRNVQINSESKIKKRKLSVNSESFIVNDIELLSSPLNSSLTAEKKPSPEEPENVCLLESRLSSNINVSSHCTPDKSVQNKTKSKEFSSVSCQTDCNFEDAMTQTLFHSNSVENLYGAPLPKKPTDETISSLMEEVNSIQNLTNKLNERRLMIFLQLARMNPSGSFVSDDITKKNFIETVTSGNQLLVESLKQFFTHHYHQQNYKHTRCRSNESKRKSPERHTGRNRSRNWRREEK